MDILKYFQGLQTNYYNLIETEKVIKNYFNIYFKSFRGIPLQYKYEIFKIIYEERVYIETYINKLSGTISLEYYQKELLRNIIMRNRRIY